MSARTLILITLFNLYFLLTDLYLFENKNKVRLVFVDNHIYIYIYRDYISFNFIYFKHTRRTNKNSNT